MSKFAALIRCRAVTPDFGALAERQYWLEGAFRRLHTRLRAHAESVAFFGGGAREGATVDAAFLELQARCTLQELRRSMHMSPLDGNISVAMPMWLLCW